MQSCVDKFCLPYNCSMQRALSLFLYRRFSLSCFFFIFILFFFLFFRIFSLCFCHSTCVCVCVCIRMDSLLCGCQCALFFFIRFARRAENGPKASFRISLVCASHIDLASCIYTYTVYYMKSNRAVYYVQRGEFGCNFD